MKLNTLNDEETQNRLKVYRRVFGTPDGLALLRLLLADWCFFTHPQTEEQRVMSEYAKEIVQDLKQAGLDLTANITLEDRGNG